MGPPIQHYKQWIAVTVRRLLRRLGAAVIVLFGLLVLSFVLYVGYTAWRLRQVAQGWASSFESMQAFATRFPKTATSSGAWQLHELTKPLGIDMLGKTAKSDRLDAIGAFVTAQELVADDVERTASADVTQFLGEHARRIDAIEDHLLGGSELLWERDLQAGFAAPLPDLIGHRHLQHILLARALEEARQGHSAEADRDISTPLGRRDCKFLKRSISVADGSIGGWLSDPFEALGGTYAMRTIDTGSPGGTYKPLPAIPGAGNVFFGLGK